MTTRVLELLLANVLMLVLGCGLLPFLRLARTRRELLTRAPLGYAVGLAATGILGADLAVAYVSLGRVLLPVLAAVSLFLGLRSVPGGGRPRRLSISGLPALAVLAATLFVAVPMVRLLAVKPLAERDGWEIWAARARALYEFGHPAAPVFTDPIYPALQHPLLLPGLEAIDFRFMGAFDGTLVHLQLFGLAVGFVGGAWTLFRGTTRPILLAATLLALVATPTFVNQLQTNYADIPLAMFIALGVAALASWLRTGAEGMLPAAALFLAAGALTKNEGEMFALTAILAGLAVARGGQHRPLLLAAGAVFLADLPWRIWIEVEQVKTSDYSLSNLFDPRYLADHADRVGPSAHELLRQIWTLGSWSYLVVLALVALVGAAILGRFRLAGFAAGWLVLSFAGLTAIYWISIHTLSGNLYNSSDRTIDSLVLTAGLLAPILLFKEREPEAAVRMLSE